MSVPVTVLVPLYNGIEYLEECLQSVKDQIYTNWTCVVGVNGHGDTNSDVFLSAQKIIQGLQDPRFLVVNLPGVKGAPAAINSLVASAKTEWVAHLDADDKWYPMKLHCQIKIVEQGSGADVIGTFCEYFGEWSGGPSIPGGYVPNQTFVRENPMIHSSILIRKELAYYTDEFVTYDYDCWVRLAMQNKIFFNVPLAITCHRVYAQSHFNASGKQRPDLVQAKYFIQK